MQKTIELIDKKTYLMMLMNKFKLAVISGIIAFNSYTAIADTTVAEEPRWFEVEIIVFKSTSNGGLFEESWRKDTQLTQAENLIDFVQPFDQISLNDIKNTEDTTVVVNNQQNISNVSQISTQETTVQSTINEPPFILLPDESRQLLNEAKSLGRHPDYHVLLHQAWRQPVLNSREAPHIRIAGGKDFSAEYQYDGSKVSIHSYSEEAIQEPTTMDSNEPNTITANTQNSPSSQLSNHSSLTTSDKQSLTSTDQLNDSNLLVKFVRKPWVPELDGDIKVYLNRYLHVKTNLYLRRPDKEEVEVINLEMLKDQIYPTMDRSTTLTPQTLQSTNNEQSTNQSTNGLDNLLAGNNQLTSSSAQQTELLTQSKKSQFSWEIDDNFLETESEKLYIERLFNYSLKQSRKIKSGELHFFDHPLIGVLIMIRPYTIEPANPQDLPTLSSSF
ncbi:CsiV family protein [Aliikangiella sp. IMCC44359]|uniref:CsiV family protein n=1 Tax=Aliikangiella sp. IMCC44359 TaxID=3459125 RepID=UPI00403B23DF